MDFVERFNKQFAKWYEGLFQGNSRLQPKEILRAICREMEANRQIGVDSIVHVPNIIILEFCFRDDEEREAILSFLDEGELKKGIDRFCKQNVYKIRGEFQMQFEDVRDEDNSFYPNSEPLTVICKYRKSPVEPVFAPDMPPIVFPIDIEPMTEPARQPKEPMTEPSVSAMLIVHVPGNEPFTHKMLGKMTKIHFQCPNDDTK